MLNVPAARILGFVALIAAGGCGSRPGRPAVPPPAASPARVPSTVPPDATSSGPVIQADDEMPHPVPGLRRSFDAPLRAPAVATGDPELDPLVAYLKASFAAAIKDGHRLVIEETTDVEELHFRKPYQDLVDALLRQASDQVPAEMIRDFGEKNRQSRAIWPELTRHLPASLLTLGERKKLFPGFPDEGWKRFYAKYPGSPGIITVSRVGLNREKTLAFFYLASAAARSAGTVSSTSSRNRATRGSSCWSRSGRPGFHEGLGGAAPIASALAQSWVEPAESLDGDRVTRMNLAPYTCLEFRLKS